MGVVDVAGSWVVGVGDGADEAAEDGDDRFDAWATLVADVATGLLLLDRVTA